MKQRVVLNIS